MIIGRRLMRFTKSLLHINFKNIITHKFYYGQGGEMNFRLTHRSYNITIETIWDDYCLLEIDGLKGIKNFTIHEDNEKAFFQDQDLDLDEGQIINATLKVPEDYTIKGLVNGNVTHVQGQVGRKMRSKPTKLEIGGKGNKLSLGDLKTQNLQIENLNGSFFVSNLTVQSGKINSKEFQSKKVMSSQHLAIQSKNILIKSLIFFGHSSGDILSDNGDFESISGNCSIESRESIKIDRYYGGNQSINIKCSNISSKIGIQTGSGIIQFPDEERAKQNIEKIKLGRMHKGNIHVQGKKILIL